MTQEQLRAFYKMADLLLVLSDHEGFCVPIVEAFYYQVPVVARAAGAIPETAQDGALLLQNRDPEVAAHLVARLLEDSQLRSQLQFKGSEVLKRHQNFPLKETLMKIIEEVQSF
jgi:glycosyltransferase involved in cell wall biosynthesis